MTYDKFPFQSGLITDMINNLSPQAFNLYVDFIQELWNNKDADVTSWCTTLLSTLSSAKVLSMILAECLLKSLKQINLVSQFRNIGCHEAQHTKKRASLHYCTIKRASLLYCQYRLVLHTVFLNCVKAFDTAHHNLLCCIIEKIWPTTYYHLKKLDNNCKVKAKSGKQTWKWITPLEGNRVTT